MGMVVVAADTEVVVGMAADQEEATAAAEGAMVVVGPAERRISEIVAMSKTLKFFLPGRRELHLVAQPTHVLTRKGLASWTLESAFKLRISSSRATALDQGRAVERYKNGRPCHDIQPPKYEAGRSG